MKSGQQDEASRDAPPGGLGGASPSRTSQAVALTRAELTRPHSPTGDPDAQRRLCAGMPDASIGRLRASIIARTHFFDQRLLDALGNGVRQIVICGAGYDDRALRFPAPGVRFFELDHPATQDDKARRLAAMGAADAVTLVPADFRVDDVARVLADSGHDVGAPTLFFTEGLLVYLDEDTILGLLSALGSRAAGDSALAASLAVHRADLPSDQVVAAANAKRRSARTEPWRTILPQEAHLGLLRRAGWRPETIADAADLEPSAPPGRNVLVAARHETT
jgi:methyltransferase (TIGR00027 family)